MIFISFIQYIGKSILSPRIELERTKHDIKYPLKYVGLQYPNEERMILLNQQAKFIHMFMVMVTRDPEPQLNHDGVCNLYVDTTSTKPLKFLDGCFLASSYNPFRKMIGYGTFEYRFNFKTIYTSIAAGILSSFKPSHYMTFLVMQYWFQKCKCKTYQLKEPLVTDCGYR